MKTESHRLLSKRWVLAIWLALAVVSTSTLFLQLKGNSAWWELFPVKLSVWLFWGIYSPVVFKMASRFPIKEGKSYKGLLVHVPFSFFSVFIHLLIYTGILYYFNEIEQSFGDMLMMLTVFLFDWYFIIYWGMVISQNLFDYYRRFRDQELENLKLEAQLIEAQLNALKMQLHPHFLFNTLNTIVSLIRQEKSKSAISMLVGLSDLLRVALSQKDQQKVPLEAELTFIKQYLEIEKKRFQKKLSIEFESSGNSLNASVPNFLLQPVVENAIYHGVSKQQEASKLKIITRVEEDQLNISVYNEGPSLPENFDLSKTTGIGLTNTFERLTQFYDSSFSLKFENIDQGVLVSLVLPFKTYESV